MAPVLTNCAMIGANKQAPVQGACLAFSPIIINRSCDKITKKTADQILIHNLTGAKLCGWKKSKPKLNKSAPDSCLNQ